MTRTSWPTGLGPGSTPGPTAVGASTVWEALAPGAVGTLLVSDTFTDTNGTALSSHTPGTVNVLSHVLDIDATGGTYTLTVTPTHRPTGTTVALAWNATASQVQVALETLTAVDVGDVTVTGGPGGTADLTIVWAGGLAADRTPGLSSTPSLTGGASTATITATAPAWVLSGAWTVQSNKAQILAATADAVAVINPGVADVRVSCDITWGIGTDTADDHVGLVVRAVDTTTYLRFRPRKASGTRTFRLEEADGTELATFPAASAAVTEGATDTVVADLSGATMTFRVDGVTVGAFTLEGDAADTYATATGVGLWSNEQDATPDASFDAFTVAKLGGAADTQVTKIVVVGNYDYWRLAVDGASTDNLDLNYGAGASYIASTIAADLGISVDVRGGPGDATGSAPYFIEFLDGIPYTVTADISNLKRNEVQRITVDATGGNWTATIGGQTTANISAVATATTVRTSLEALSTVDPNDISVSGGPGNAGGTSPYVLTYGGFGTGQYLNTNVAEVTVANVSLTGGASTVTPSTVSTGGTPSVTITEPGDAASIDAAYARFTGRGQYRMVQVRPARPVDPEALIDTVSFAVRSRRSGVGYIRGFLVAENSQGVHRFAPLSISGSAVSAGAGYSTQSVSAGPINSAGFPWDAYETDTAFMVKLYADTTDQAAAFGTVDVSEVTVTLGWSGQPIVSGVAVDVAAGNPLVSWDFDHDYSGDEQDEYQVAVWDPATIAAAPAGTELEDIDTVYDSGRVSSSSVRAHRVAASLTAATTYRFGVRAWAPPVAGRDLVSEWDTADAATPAAVTSTHTVTPVVSGDTITVTVASPGPNTRSVIERSLDNGTTWTTVDRAGTVADATVEAVDSFNRANGGLGNEQGPDTLAWSLTGGTTGAIVSNQAEVTGSGFATVAAAAPNVRVSATVDLTGPASAVVARHSATHGWVAAVIDASTVDLVIWDEMLVAEHGSTAAVNHGVVADTARIELVCSGDEYLVSVGGRVMIRRIDATVDPDIKAAGGVGIGGAGTAGLHRFDDFSADALDGEVVYTDRGVTPATQIRYRARLYTVSASGEFYLTAAVTSSAVAVTGGEWRLTSQTSGTTLQFEPEDMTVTYPRPTDTRVVEDAVQVFGNELGPERWAMAVRTLTQADHDAVEEMLSDAGRLTLVDIFGGSWSVRAVGDVTKEQIRSRPQTGETTPVGHHHRWAFELQALTS